MLTFLLSAALAAPPPADVLPHRTFPDFQYLHAELRPLGFSPDGKLAVLYITPDEAVGCFLWELRIINLVTDEVTVPLHWEHDACEQQADIGAAWAANEPAIRAQLRAHQITPAGPLALQTFPIVAPGPGPGPVSAWVRPGAPEVRPEEGRLSVPVEVWLRSDSKDKRIGVRELRVDYDIPSVWNQEVVGYLQSPHEDRLAVLVREEQRGWEGPPNVEVVTVMGASLSRGF